MRSILYAAIPISLLVTILVAPAFSSQIPTIDGVIQEGEYSRQIREPSTGIEVHWHNDEINLWIGVESPGLGWVAVGFEPESPFHQGANLIIGYVEDGQLHVSDEYGTGALFHESDEDLGGTDDILDSAGTESEGKTIMEFKIPLDSGDEFDKILEPNENYTVLVAYQAIHDASTYPHTATGKVSVTTIPEFPSAVPIVVACSVMILTIVLARRTLGSRGRSRQ